MLNLLRLAALLAFVLCMAPSSVQAQGCGSTNPNCVVPTAPPGTSDNRAASTAFVQGAIPLIGITALTGDGTATGPGSVLFTLAIVNPNVGTFGSATSCVTVTNNAKGLTTAVSAATCTPAIGSITGLGANVAAFLATPTSANLAAAITNETGSGLVVFNNSPVFAGQITSPLVGIGAGATSPVNYLDIVDSVAGNVLANIRNTNASAGATAILQVVSTAGVANFTAASAAGGGDFNLSWTGGIMQYIAQSGSGAHIFYTGASPTPKVYIQNSGGVGVGTSTDPGAGALLATASILSNGVGGVGYAPGAGGQITQITSRNTGVTNSHNSGDITLLAGVNAAVSAATANTVVVTNTTVAITDTVNVVQKSGADKYLIFVTNVSAGSFAITFFTTGGTTNESPVFHFNVIKGVAS